MLRRFLRQNVAKRWRWDMPKCLSDMQTLEYNQLNADRMQILHKIQDMSVYRLPQLQDTLLDFIRQHDFLIASDLLSLSLRQPEFNAEIASFFILELLEEPDYDRLRLAVGKLEEFHKAGKVDTMSWTAAMECALVFAAEKEAEKLMSIIPKGVLLDQNLIETLILKIFTPGKNIAEIVKYAQLAQDKGILLSKEMWSSVFDAILLPPDVENLPYTEAAMRDTDRQFHLLQSLLDKMRKSGVKLRVPICEALNYVCENHLLPEEFLRYLESIVKL